MDYLQNFEKLCPGLVFDYPKDKPKYEKLKEEIDQYSPSPFKNIDTKYNPIYVQAGGYYFLVGERIDVLFRRVLYQLFWYIEAVEQYPDDRVQQSKYLHDEIERMTDKFVYEFKYDIDNLLNDLTYKDRETANKVFNDILYITNNLIRTLRMNYNHHFRFQYTESPLFVVLMEFVQSINERAGNIAYLYPEVKAYFENIDSYKDLFEFEPPQAKSEGLKISQIAIIHVYNGIQITRENGIEIAKKYNWNSGEKLFHKFTYYSSAANRKGKPTPCTPKKLKNKIELFESVIPHLNDTAKKRANDEIQILKSILESEYQ